MRAVALACLLAWATVFVTGQVLNAEVRDVSTFSSCINSPLAIDPSLAKRMTPTGVNNLQNVTDRTPCGLLGEETSVTAITLFLSQNQRAGGETLVFQITNLPTDADTYDQSSDLDCTGTTRGTDCQLLAEPFTITFETSSVALSYALRKDPTPIPYAMLWQQGESELRVDQGEFADLPPDPTRGFYVETSQGMDCATLNNQLKEDGDDSFFGVLDNAGAVGDNLQSQVCPTPDQVDADVRAFYPQSGDGADGFYTLGDTTCDVLLCPAGTETVFEFGFGELELVTFTNWTAGFMQPLAPSCQVLRLQQEPRTTMNIAVLIGSSDVEAAPNGTETSTYTQQSQILLSTLQDGALVPDSLGLAVAGIIDVKTPVGFSGQPLAGGFTVCGTCSVTDTTNSEDGTQCIPGIVSDVPRGNTDPGTVPENCLFNPQRSVSDTMKSMISEDEQAMATDNPYTTSPGGVTAVCNGCTVPTQACRQQVTQNPDELAFYMYYTEEQMATMFGSGCSKNGEAPNVYSTRPEVAELICSAGMNGACVPGYQQTVLGNKLTSFTPCQIALSWAQKLRDKGGGQFGVGAQSISFQPGVPNNWNQEVPQCWMDGLNWMCTPENSGQIEAEVQLYTTAEELGEIISFATADFTDSAMLCGGPQDSTAGEVVAYVQNTGGSVGSYVVRASFSESVMVNTTVTTTSGDIITTTTNSTTATTSTFDVTQVGTCRLSLNPGEIGPCVITYTFSGPIDTDLLVNLVLEADIVAANRPPPLLDVRKGVTCFISAANDQSGVFGASDADLSHLIDDGDDDDSDGDDDDDYCPAYKPLFICRPSGLLGWLAKVVEMFAVTFLLVLIPLAWYFVIESCVRTRKTNKELKQTISLQSTASTALMLMFLFTVVSAQTVDILGVSSFVECVNPGGANTTLNCAGSQFATTLDLRVTTTSSQNIDAATFNVNLTVVPNQNSNEQQTGAANRCPAPTDTPCQTTTPGQVTIEVDEAVLVYGLTEVSSIVEVDGFTIPYNYLYSPVTTIRSSTDVNVGAPTDLLFLSDVHCSLLTFYYTNSPQSRSSSATSTNINVTTLFFDAPSNQQYLRCDIGAEPPQDPTQQVGDGVVVYDFLCSYPVQDGTSCGGGCDVILQYTANFQPLEPQCSVWQVTNPPSVSANIRVNVTTPLGGTESISIQSVTAGQNGASAVSSPDRFVSATILTPLEPDGLLGPDMPGYIVTCTSDGEPLNMVPDNVPTGINNVPPGVLSFNPWRERPTAGTAQCPFTGEPYPTYPLPEPCGLSFLTDDPYAMFYYVNTTLAPTVGRQCGQLGVDPTLYTHPPPVMGLTGFTTQNAQAFAPQAILQPVDCDAVGFNSSLCGTFADLVTCVPGFGIGYLDLPTRTPCNQMGYFRDMEEEMESFGDSKQARSLLVEGLPLQWDNFRGNFWTRDFPSYSLIYEPVADTFAFEVLLTIAGQFVDYPQQVTNGEIQTSGTGTFCAVNVTGGAVDGGAFFKVCNEDRLGSTGSYNLLVECGLRTDYDDRTNSFSEQTIITTPSSLLLSGVEAGTCRTAATDRPILLEVIAPNTNITTGSGASNVLCSYTLLSADTTVPSEVLLSQTEVVCTATYDPNFVLGNTTALAPPGEREPFLPDQFAPTPSTNGTDTGLSTAAKATIGVSVGILVLLICLVPCLALCIMSIKQRNLNKQLEKS